MKEIKLRHNKLLNRLPENSVVILSSGLSKKQSEDANYEFFTNRHFFYLSNISQENSTLLLVKNENKAYLFIDEFNQKKEKWFGKKLTIEEAKKASGLSNVLLNNSLTSKLKGVIDDDSIIYLDFNSDLSTCLKKQYKNYEIRDIYPLISELRTIKDESEINNIKEAIKITHLGLKKVVELLKNKQVKNECEIYNAFNHEILNHGTHELGFPSIIATGVHTCCLHYPTPDDVIAKDSLILCDVGAGYHHYSADITRTYPINGHFNPFQRMIYTMVLNCNKEVIKLIKPGINIKDLQAFAKSYLASQCISNGLIKKAEEIDKYYFHSVSHLLGLDTHDVGGRDIILKPGMVLTVEPGLYIEEKKTGVRIEDDVLVTETGHKVLTSEVKKEINDIEELFK